MNILVVEDERKLAEVLTRGLSREGFVVECAYDGDAALASVLSNAFDVVILDVMLPKQSGLEVLAQARRSGIKTPILLLTALDALPSRIAGFRAGADDYLTKPFDFEELIERVRALLRRAPLTELAELQFSGLTLQPATNTVSHALGSVVLTEREFHLLEYLLHKAPQAVSKNELIEHVWNLDDDILPNTVEVYVGYLRKKLESAGLSKVVAIRTERGKGYSVIL